MALNIVNLIENNPISKLSTTTYQSKLLNKIRDNFTDDEQHLFIASFYCYLNFNDKDFAIDIDNIWQWLGFSRKDHAKELLTKKCTIDIDYKVISPRAGENSKVGRPIETILMTIKAFKKLCMKAGTKRADQIHDYYINLEEILLETMSEESKELQTKFEEQSVLLQSTQTAFESQHERFKKYMRKKYYDCEPGQMVYVYKNDVNDPQSMIRVGKTDNIKKRETDYNHSNLNGEIVFAKPCHNNDLLEKVCHHILDKYRIYREQEWFNINENIAIQVVKIAHLFMDELIPQVEFLDDNVFEKISDIICSLKPEDDEPDKLDKQEPYASNYDKINTKIQEEKQRPVETQEFIANEPLNFKKFISDACDIGDDFVCLKVDIYGAHKLWSRNQEKKTKDAIFEYFKKNYKEGKEFFKEHDSTLAVFYGIKPKEYIFTSEDVNNPNEFEKFIIDRCKVGYTYRTSYQMIYDEFQAWNTQNIENYELDNFTKTKIREYMNVKFFPTVVYLNSGLSTSSHGVWGITLKTDSTNAGIKLSHNLKKKLVQIDVQTKKIVNSWDSLSSAAKSFNLSPSSLSTDIRFNRIRNNCVLQYIKKS